jgi:hypothetical protein
MTYPTRPPPPAYKPLRHLTYKGRVSIKTKLKCTQRPDRAPDSYRFKTQRGGWMIIMSEPLEYNSGGYWRWVR